jgi:hypothetical protein
MNKLKSIHIHSTPMFYMETQSRRKPQNGFSLCLEELHSLEAPTSFVFQLQLEGGSNPLVSQATT